MLPRLEQAEARTLILIMENLTKGSEEIAEIAGTSKRTHDNMSRRLAARLFPDAKLKACELKLRIAQLMLDGLTVADVIAAVDVPAKYQRKRDFVMRVRDQ